MHRLLRPPFFDFKLPMGLRDEKPMSTTKLVAILAITVGLFVLGILNLRDRLSLPRSPMMVLSGSILQKAFRPSR